ncbi:MFS transporter [Cytobacillus spongiae]|jgi:MFS family permease|uniref:MFS transporter n=1 Tax=Cytobacillus spongiae TaxID=2901381 RepID=UPI001F2049C0|nr:MFS transporter [Cytobacillus spongiae]UII57188.1 MFS transporter [Cytobacillus spongiae]
MNNPEKLRLQVYLIGMLLASFGTGFHFILVSWLLFEETGNAALTGIFVGLGFLPGLIVNLFFGVIVDRFSRKKLTILSVWLITVIVGLFLMLWSLTGIKIWMFFGLHMMVQLSGSLFRPSVQAFAAEIFPYDQLTKVYSFAGAVGETGVLLGASLGGFLLAILSPFIALSFNGCLFLVAGLLFIFLPSFPVNSVSRRGPFVQNVFQDLLEGLNYLRGNRLLYKLFFIMFVGQLTLHSTVGLLSVYTYSFLEKGSGTYGLLDASVSIGSILAGMIAVQFIKRTRGRFGTYALFFSGIGICLLVIAQNIFVAGVGLMVIGAGTTWIRVLFQTVQQISTEGRFHGRMASWRMVFNQGSVVIGAPVLGVIAERTAANIAYSILLIPISIITVYSYLLAKDNSFIAKVEEMSLRG